MSEILGWGLVALVAYIAVWVLSAMYFVQERGMSDSRAMGTALWWPLWMGRAIYRSAANGLDDFREN